MSKYDPLCVPFAKFAEFAEVLGHEAKYDICLEGVYFFVACGTRRDVLRRYLAGEFDALERPLRVLFEDLGLIPKADGAPLTRGPKEPVVGCRSSDSVVGP
ncbi:hypothetical protein [Corallococcus sp. 4LFB]|uniref:hypothetical protein n=1 Tax=Corallococcus sp. 4LFB TaxID=3383249 RepID=UPI0039767913